MIRETCSCGATFQADGTFKESAAIKWRDTHKCFEPTTVLAEVHDSGQGLAEVIDAVDRVAANVGLLTEIVIAYIKAQR